jgi:hypothetical protein
MIFWVILIILLIARGALGYTYSQTPYIVYYYSNGFTLYSPQLAASRTTEPSD